MSISQLLYGDDDDEVTYEVERLPGQLYGLGSRTGRADLSAPISNGGSRSAYAKPDTSVSHGLMRLLYRHRSDNSGLVAQPEATVASDGMSMIDALHGYDNEDEDAAAQGQRVQQGDDTMDGEAEDDTLPLASQVTSAVGLSAAVPTRAHPGSVLPNRGPGPRQAPWHAVSGRGGTVGQRAGHPVPQGDRWQQTAGRPQVAPAVRPRPQPPQQQYQQVHPQLARPLTETEVCEEMMRQSAGARLAQKHKRGAVGTAGTLSKQAADRPVQLASHAAATLPKPGEGVGGGTYPRALGMGHSDPFTRLFGGTARAPSGSAAALIPAQPPPPPAPQGPYGRPMGPHGPPPPSSSHGTFHAATVQKSAPVAAAQRPGSALSSRPAPSVPAGVQDAGAGTVRRAQAITDKQGATTGLGDLPAGLLGPPLAPGRNRERDPARARDEFVCADDELEEPDGTGQGGVGVGVPAEGWVGAEDEYGGGGDSAAGNEPSTDLGTQAGTGQGSGVRPMPSYRSPLGRPAPVVGPSSSSSRNAAMHDPSKVNLLERLQKIRGAVISEGNTLASRLQQTPSLRGYSGAQASSMRGKGHIEVRAHGELEGVTGGSPLSHPRVVYRCVVTCCVGGERLGGMGGEGEVGEGDEVLVLLPRMEVAGGGERSVVPLIGAQWDGEAPVRAAGGHAAAHTTRVVRLRLERPFDTRYLMLNGNHLVLLQTSLFSPALTRAREAGATVWPLLIGMPYVVEYKEWNGGRG